MNDLREALEKCIQLWAGPVTLMQADKIATSAMLIRDHGPALLAAIDERDALRPVLKQCREKLVIERQHSSGIYHGGVEHTELLRRIDKAMGGGRA